MSPSAIGRVEGCGTPRRLRGQGHAADPPQHRSLLSGRARGHSGRHPRGGKQKSLRSSDQRLPLRARRLCARNGSTQPRGQSPDSRITAPPSLPRASAPVASLGITPRSQWRDRAGLSPASLFRPRRNADPAYGHLRDTQLSWDSVPSAPRQQPNAVLGPAHARTALPWSLTGRIRTESLGDSWSRRSQPL
jgi:hypothetical protein